MADATLPPQPVTVTGSSLVGHVRAAVEEARAAIGEPEPAAAARLDMFAAAALTGLLANGPSDRPAVDASDAYDRAEAMERERAKRLAKARS